MQIFLSAKHTKIKDAYEDVASQILRHHGIARPENSKQRALTQLVNLQERDPDRFEGGYEFVRHEDHYNGHKVEGRPLQLSKRVQTRSRTKKTGRNPSEAPADRDVNAINEGVSNLSLRTGGSITIQGVAGIHKAMAEFSLDPQASTEQSQAPRLNERPAQPPTAPLAHREAIASLHSPARPPAGPASWVATQQRNGAQGGSPASSRPGSPSLYSRLQGSRPASPAFSQHQLNSPSRPSSPSLYSRLNARDDMSDRQSVFTQRTVPRTESRAGGPSSIASSPANSPGRSRRGGRNRRNTRNSAKVDDDQLAHVNAIFSQLSLRRSKLEVLQAILRVLDFEESEIPDTVTQCRKKLHTIHVNICDVAEALQKQYKLGGGLNGPRTNGGVGGNGGGGGSDASSAHSRASYASVASGASSNWSDWKSGLSVGDSYQIPRYTLQGLRAELRKQKKRRFPLARVKDELLSDLLRPLR